MADPEIAEAYRNAPAAKTLHHAYIGGLLDHVVSLFRSCDLMCRNYPQINRDLLLTGAFLHDIGKIHELTYNRSFSYTTRGQLLGHMIIELEMLQAKLAAGSRISRSAEDAGGAPHHQPSRPVRFRLAQAAHVPRSAHAALSRRSRFEDGELCAPSSSAAGNRKDAWTSYNPSLGRPLLNTAKFLAGKKVAAGRRNLREITAAPSRPIRSAGRSPKRRPTAEEKSDAAMTSAAHEDKI